MIDLFFRSLFVCGAALFLAWLFRRSSAGTRYLLLRLTTLTLLALVPLYFLLPSLELAILPARPLQPTIASGTFTEQSASFDWPSALLTLWLIGSSIGIVRLAGSLLSLRKLVRAHEGGLLVSDRVTAPCTVGILQPVILLPSSSRTWSQDRLEMVLLHEGTHIARGDWLWLVLARFAVVLFWPNPFAHLLERATRLACEESCDDQVLAKGISAANYSSMLMSLARELDNGGKLLAPGVLAVPTLERRLATILSASTKRKEPKRFMAVSLAFLALCSVTVLASVRLSHTDPSPNPALYATSTKPASGKKPLLVVDMPTLKPSKREAKTLEGATTSRSNRSQRPATRVLDKTKLVPLKSAGEPGPARATSSDDRSPDLQPARSTEPGPATSGNQEGDAKASESTNIVKDARAAQDSDEAKLEAYAHGSDR